MGQNTSKMTFKELSIGDVFNTISGRFVKISDTQFMSIMEVGNNKLGEIHNADSLIMATVFPLYTAIK